MNNREEILSELKAAAPLMAALKEKEALPLVPAGYFDGLADAVIASVNRVHFFGNKETADVPEGYFETFADNVLAKIRSEENKISKGTVVAPQKGRVLYLFKRIAVAASIIGMVLLIRQWQQPVLSNDCTDGIACLTQEEIFDYVNENSNEFDVQQVQEAVQPALETSDVNSIDKTEAAAYIESNTLDMEDASTDIF